MNTFILNFLVPLVLVYWIWLLISNPKQFILIFITISPLINLFWEYEFFGFSLIEIFSGILPLVFVFVMFVKMSQGGWKWGKYHKLFLLILIIFFIPIVKAMVAGEPMANAAKLFIKILCGYASYNIFINFFTFKDQRKLVYALLAGVSIVLAIAIVQILRGSGFVAYGDRLSLIGPYHDPGEFTRMSLLAIILVLPIIRLFRSGLQNNLRIGILVLAIVTLGFAISRNVVLSAAGVIVAYGLIRRKIVVSLLVVGLAAGLYISSPSVQAQYQGKLYYEFQYLQGNRGVVLEQLGSGRVGIWQRAIASFKQESLFEQILGSGRDIGPHGQLFGLLMAVGILGLGAILFFYLKLFIDALNRLRRDRNNLAALYCALLLVSFFILMIASAPLTEFYHQIALFAFVAMSEKKEREWRAVSRSRRLDPRAPVPAAIST